jgi:hypothetical protein
VSGDSVTCAHAGSIALDDHTCCPDGAINASVTNGWLFQ